jgi:hypothetical protein
MFRKIRILAEPGEAIQDNIVLQCTTASLPSVIGHPEKGWAWQLRSAGNTFGIGTDAWENREISRSGGPPDRVEDMLPSHPAGIKRRSPMPRLTSALLLLLIATAPVLAEDMPVNADAIKWAPAPPFMPAGAKMAVIAGDPSKDGIFVLRLMMPADYQIPAHNHPTSEYVTVLSGDFNMGMGDKLDEAHGMHLTAGGFGVAPAGMNHFAWTTSATIVQVHGEGPFAITYVNPAEDPAKK